MNLNLDAIAERLSEGLGVVRVHAGNTSRFLDRVMLYTGEPMRDDGAIYVAQSGDLPKSPCMSDFCCVASIGPPPQAFISGRSNCIVLGDSADCARVLNELQQIFFQFKSRRDRLYRALFLDKGIQSVISEAQRIFENPVYVHDKSYRIIAYAEGGSLSDTEDSYGIQSYGRMSVKTIKALNELPEFKKTFDATAPTYWEKTGGWADRFSYLYSNLRVGGQYCGRIFVDERIRPISKADYVVLDELASIIELVLQRHNVFEERRPGYFEAAMVKLLESGEPDAGKLDAELMDFGWSRRDSYFCFQIHLAEHESLFYASTGICGMLESNIHDCRAVAYKENIIAVVNGRQWAGRRHVFDKKILPILESFNLRAGISQTFNDLAGLSAYYRQTVIALKFGRERSPASYIHYFESCTLDYLLGHCVSEFPAEMLCPRALLKLIDYDRKNYTVYSDTLRAYLECDSSPAKAMDRLFIHRSTLLYRLNRIQELIDADLSDFKTKLHFLLAFQLLGLPESADKKAAAPAKAGSADSGDAETEEANRA